MHFSKTNEIMTENVSVLKKLMAPFNWRGTPIMSPAQAVLFVQQHCGLFWIGERAINRMFGFSNEAVTDLLKCSI
jgi:hypothetical protein